MRCAGRRLSRLSGSSPGCKRPRLAVGHPCPPPLRSFVPAYSSKTATLRRSGVEKCARRRHLGGGRRALLGGRAGAGRPFPLGSTEVPTKCAWPTTNGGDWPRSRVRWPFPVAFSAKLLRLARPARRSAPRRATFAVSRGRCACASCRPATFRPRGCRGRSPWQRDAGAAQPPPSKLRFTPVNSVNVY
jgi:hypothetical protein